jgi:hypothetical protein
VRHLLSLLLLSALFAATAPSALSQDRPGPSDDVNGFEAIDGTTLKPATLAYDAAVTMGDRSLNLSATQTVAATSTGETATWTLVNTIDTPRGTSTDSLVMDRSSLLPLSRHRSGTPTIDVSFTDTSASGEMRVRGRSTPIDARLQGPTLAGGVHDVVAVGAMPLAPGFRAALRVFSPQDQATKKAAFEVTGTETVQVPAGSFETYAVDLNVGDGYVTGTVHLRKQAPHYLVKWRTQVSTDRGARTITQELTSLEVSGAP